MTKTCGVIIVFTCFFCSIDLLAQPWVFSAPLTVSRASEKNVFHHLESSGRRNIAVSGNTVALVWEDDSDAGTPRIYLARKRLDADQFSSIMRISGEGEAFEPTITALDEGHFALAWEENDQVSVRIATPGGLGPIVRLGKPYSAQASLTGYADRLLLVFRQQKDRFGQVVFQELKITNQLQLSPSESCQVDSGSLIDDQLYPVVVFSKNAINVAWEDRRLGHTVIMFSHSEPDERCRFSPPTRVSEAPPGPKSEFGTGHGVARVSLATYDEFGVYAAWADKRDFQEGYDIYGAAKQSDHAFSKNERIQDDFGAEYRQWHASASGHPAGHLVVAWTDEREATKDVLFSWLEQGAWSDDNAVPGASGKGIQYHPSIVLDADGDLHVSWIHRDEEGGATQVRYQHGKLRTDTN